MTLITEKRLRPEALLSSVAASGRGAQCLFVGVVRDRHEGRRVRAVTYDAFLPLAEKTLAAIAKEAERPHGAKVAVAHRLGRVRVGEASVAVAAAAPHRAEAFAACRAVIEAIKRRLPVWKKEHYPRGESRWLEGCSLVTRGRPQARESRASRREDASRRP